MIYIPYQVKMDVTVEATLGKGPEQSSFQSTSPKNPRLLSEQEKQEQLGNIVRRYLQKWLFFLDCVVLEMLFNNSNSYHGSQSFTIKRQPRG